MSTNYVRSESQSLNRHVQNSQVTADANTLTTSPEQTQADISDDWDVFLFLYEPAACALRCAVIDCLQPHSLAPDVDISSDFFSLSLSGKPLCPLRATAVFIPRRSWRYADGALSDGSEERASGRLAVLLPVLDRIGVRARARHGVQVLSDEVGAHADSARTCVKPREGVGRLDPARRKDVQIGAEGRHREHRLEERRRGEPRVEELDQLDAAPVQRPALVRGEGRGAREHAAASAFFDETDRVDGRKRKVRSQICRSADLADGVVHHGPDADGDMRWEHLPQS
eukprot:CAMPEP_0119389882 /NCGR_PEP_ID=MMETSP1334-20130426/111149_1 /TAXON_ID=127549 /ORGANISM="Calcidiscus leptoporus, Strain RCC1130" /LENGTH=283 /DNA_ID=CAMNT_0007412229 /DNA_START=313 /DNA_END=1165 /DNA_ORIENTATION=+